MLAPILNLLNLTRIIERTIEAAEQHKPPDGRTMTSDADVDVSDPPPLPPKEWPDSQHGQEKAQ